MTVAGYDGLGLIHKALRKTHGKEKIALLPHG